MTRPLLHLLTLEDFHRPSGQTARLGCLVPHLAERFELGWIGRPGGLTAELAGYFTRRSDLPVPPGVTMRAWLLHPLGPLRLARLRLALGRLATAGAIVYADSILLASMAAHSPRRLLAAEVNGIIAEELRARAPRAAPFVARWEEAAFGQPDRLIAVSEGIASYITECLARRPAAGSRKATGAAGAAPAGGARIRIIGNGIDPARFHPGVAPEPVRAARGWGAADPIGIFVSTFRPWHGAEGLLRAAALVRAARRDFRLLLVGDGPGRPAAERLAGELDLGEAVYFAGRVAPEAVPRWLAAADLALYYSEYAPAPRADAGAGSRPATEADEGGRTSRGFLGDPIKLHEYMAMGKPVAAAGWGDFGAPVRAGGAGIVTEPSPPALARSILTLLADPAGAAAMGRAGAHYAARHHTWQAVAGRIAEAIEPAAAAPTL